MSAIRSLLCIMIAVATVAGCRSGKRVSPSPVELVDSRTAGQQGVESTPESVGTPPIVTPSYAAQPPAVQQDAVQQDAEEPAPFAPVVPEALVSHTTQANHALPAPAAESSVIAPQATSPTLLASPTPPVVPQPDAAQSDASLPAPFSQADNRTAPQRNDSPSIAATRPQARLKISGVIPGRGPVMVAVFNSADNFPDSESAIAKFQLIADQQVVDTTFDIDGTLAFAVFQDIDGNGEITRGKFGIPIEPFAFSNGATVKRKAPSFDEAAVFVAADTSQVVSFHLSNLR